MCRHLVALLTAVNSAPGLVLCVLPIADDIRCGRQVINDETSEDDKKRFLEDLFHLFGEKSKTKFDEDVA